MNKFMITGNISTDIESSTTQSGKEVAKFSIAVRRPFAKEGEDTTDFFKCVAFGGKAEVISKHLSKGRKVLIIGSVQINTYQAQDGTNKSYPQVMVDDVEFLDKAPTQNKGSDGLKEDKEQPNEKDLPF